MLNIAAQRVIAQIDALRALHEKGDWPPDLVLQVALISMQASAYLMSSEPAKATACLDEALFVVTQWKTKQS